MSLSHNHSYDYHANQHQEPPVLLRDGPRSSGGTRQRSDRAHILIIDNYNKPKSVIQYNTKSDYINSAGESETVEILWCEHTPYKQVVPLYEHLTTVEE